jgi:hypothetical protein
LQLRNVAQIVQGKRIVRIEQISLVEKRFSLGVVVLADGFYAFAIEALDGSEVAALGQSDFNVAGSGLRCRRQRWAVFSGGG